MREHSDRDSLSGVMLRRAFVEAVQRALAVCHRETKPLVLVLCDLDHFKQINDTHGHLVTCDLKLVEVRPMDTGAILTRYVRA